MTLSLISGAKRALVLFGFFLSMVFRPIRVLLSFGFRTFFVPLYSVYRKIKKGIFKIILPAKQSFLYPLFNQHMVFVVISVITLAILFNNILLQDVRAEQIGKKSIVASLSLEPEADYEEEIVGVPPREKTTFAGLVTPAQASSGSDIQITSGNSRLGNVAFASITTEQNNERRNVIQYTVQGGDTISTIAEQFSISTQSVLWANGMNEFDLIKPGQNLKIPPVSGVVHAVASGDTIGSIARKYNVSENTILEYNRLADGSLVAVGQTLIVPGGAPPAPPKPVVTSTAVATGGQASSASAPPSATATTGVRFMWPTPSHRINQYFRYGHTGVDIDGDYSSPIYAAASGVVTTVSYLRYGYGYHIIIRHSDGTQTLYGHASKIFVSAGQSVSQGQTIAIVGSTGRSTGTHLHFEIIVGGRKINPLGYIR